MTVATLYTLYKSLTGEDENPIGVHEISSHEWVILAIGFVVSFIVAYGAVAWFMGYVRKRAASRPCDVSYRAWDRSTGLGHGTDRNVICGESERVLASECNLQLLMRGPFRCRRDQKIIIATRTFSCLFDSSSDCWRCVCRFERHIALLRDKLRRPTCRHANAGSATVGQYQRNSDR